MTITKFLLCASALLSALAVLEGRGLQEKPLATLHKWTNLKLSFPTEAERKSAIKNGYYDRNKPLPVDVDLEYGDDGYHRTFLTIPRLSLGVPYSLAVVADSSNSTLLNPKLEPYPSYDWHSSHGRNCSGITSAIRTFIDECWRLWVVDSGEINSLQYCPAQILAFDLVSDQLVHRYYLPTGLYKPGVSVFSALAVDVGDAEPKLECSDTMVYIADPWAYGLIVYDAAAGRSWRVEHESMRPDADLQKLNAASDGVFTVSVSPKRATEGERQLYFHALNSYKEIRVPLYVLNNASLWTQNPRSAADEFVVVGSRGTQCESEVMDSDGNLYCSLISSHSLITWKQDSPYNSDNLHVVSYSPGQLKFVTGLKINRNSLEEDELWALSSDPQLFVGGKVKQGDIKFQVMGCRTNDLLSNKKCTVGAVAAPA